MLSSICMRIRAVYESHLMEFQEFYGPTISWCCCWLRSVFITKWTQVAPSPPTTTEYFISDLRWAMYIYFSWKNKKEIEPSTYRDLCTRHTNNKVDIGHKIKTGIRLHNKFINFRLFASCEFSEQAAEMKECARFPWNRRREK